MRLRSILLGLLALAASWVHAAPPATPVSLTGRWLLTYDWQGTPGHAMMDLKQEGERLEGHIQGNQQKLQGTFQGEALHLTVVEERGGTTVDGTWVHGALSGSIVHIDNADKEHPDSYRFTATRAPARPAGPPRRHDFVPSVFHREFSPLHKPVLSIAPGDTVHTTTVDAGGSDERGQRRVLGGNPQTGPFYVESAMPGDTLVVHLTRVRLNRDYALSDDGMVDRSLGTRLAVKMKDGGRLVRWHLDLAKGLATLEGPGEHMGHFSIPVHPMLGCVATAPAPSRAAPPTGDSGSFGGNMDFNEVVEGATVYLPVSVPGALLYVGDGHAVQGDGELNGNALETSLDVEFTVDVLPQQRTPAPRVESGTQIMAVGFGGSLDDAFRDATNNMAQWLTQRYQLTPSEVALVLGPSAHYQVGEVADRNASIVLKLNKDVLATLSPGAP